MLKTALHGPEGHIGLVLDLGPDFLNLGLQDVLLLEGLDFSNTPQDLGIFQGLGAPTGGRGLGCLLFLSLTLSTRGFDLPGLLIPVVAGLPVTIADALLFFLLKGGIDLVEIPVVAFGKHRHVDSLGEGHADTGISREGGSCRQRLVGGSYVRPSLPVG